MSKQPNAIALADQLKERFGATVPTSQAAAELRRQHALIAELVEAMVGLDEAYCRAGTQLSKSERSEDRARLIAARQAIAKAKEAQQ